MIIDSTIIAENSSTYGTSGGKNTTDKVFLLSIAEAEKYFDSDDARLCTPTGYAKTQGIYVSRGAFSDGKATCWWWLRSPGINSHHAAIVDFDGSIREVRAYATNHTQNENEVDYGHVAVRPAMWIGIG